MHAVKYRNVLLEPVVIWWKLGLVNSWKKWLSRSLTPCLRPVSSSFCLFVCLFVVINPENPYSAFRLGLEVKPLGVYPLGPRSSSCSPTKGTSPPRINLRANSGQNSTRWRVGSHYLTYASPIQTHPQPLNTSQDPPRLIPPMSNTQDRQIVSCLKYQHSRKSGWEKGRGGNPSTIW